MRLTWICHRLLPHALNRRAPCHMLKSQLRVFSFTPAIFPASLLPSWLQQSWLCRQSPPDMPRASHILAVGEAVAEINQGGE